MLIGFDASRAFTKENTGTENYSLNLLRALAKIDRKNSYRVYLREISNRKSQIANLRKEYPKNFEFRVIRPSRLWTQIGLALETWRAPVDVLFVPAHTLPILRRRSIGIFNFQFTIYNSPKCVVTIHDLGVEFLPGYHKFPQRHYLDLASKYAARNADRLIAVSRATKRDLVKRYGVASDKISVVYEGVDREFFKPRTKDEVLRIKKKYKVDGDYFLYVGTVQPRKNLVFLIDIFNTFVKKMSVKNNSAKYNKSYPEISLVIAGKMGWDYQAILARVKEFGSWQEGDKLQKLIKFVGYVAGEDLPALYSGARALVSPSLFEGFNLPILEALSCGTGVIASDIAVHRELKDVITRGYNEKSRPYELRYKPYKGAVGSGSADRGLANSDERVKNRDKKPDLGRFAKAEAMTLAKLGSQREWVSYLYQIMILTDQNRSSGTNRFLDGKYWGWERVAKETLEVLNGEIKQW